MQAGIEKRKEDDQKAAAGVVTNSRGFFSLASAAAAIDAAEPANPGGGGVSATARDLQAIACGAGRLVRAGLAGVSPDEKEALEAAALLKHKFVQQAQAQAPPQEPAQEHAQVQGDTLTHTHAVELRNSTQTGI